MSKQITETSQIIPNLFMGSWASRKNINDYGINHVFSLLLDTEYNHFAFHAILPVAVTEDSYRINDLNMCNLEFILNDCLPKIHSKLLEGKTVLVHCGSGIFSSTSIILAYLIVYRKMKLASAFKLVKEKRLCIEPKPYWWSKLEALERGLNT